MHKKMLVWPVLFLAFFVFSGCQNNTTIPAVNNEDTILFYSNQCPHCKDVENYIAENNIRTKLTFLEKEVSAKDSADLMIARQKDCKIAQEMVGSVPFLWTKDKCYIGSDEIIQYFKDKTAQ